MKEQQKKQGKLKAWWQAHKPTKRRLIQLYAALLVNANIKGFFRGRIFTGGSKSFCIPGLNCYSCPGAIGACPLGALQNALASSGTRAPYYVFGILILFGLLLGRTICGFLCPIGLGQELLYKIKTPKLKKSRYTRLFSYLKYVILAVFVVAIPVLYSLEMTAVPGFCKYICPAGTLGGAVSLLIHPDNADMFGMLGPIFTWKFCLMIAICLACVFIFRAFCRFLCPLGAIYGFFNKISLLGVKLDKNKCTDCGLCVSHCKMDIKHVGDHECINCGECMDICPAKAISWKGSKLFLHKNAAEAAEAGAADIRPIAIDAAAGAADIRPIAIDAAAGEDRMKEKSEINEMSEASGTEETENVRRRSGRGRGFWLQAGAWAVALVVLAGALIYYNFIFKAADEVQQPPIDNVDPTPDDGSSIPYGNEVGMKCFNFSLETYLGKGTFTLKEHRGEVVVINFWYTSCGPCVAEMPHINRLAEEYEITVVAVHSAQLTTNPATREGVEEWLREKKDAEDASRVWADYSIIFAQDTGTGLSTSDTYLKLGGKESYPMTLVVAPDGVIYYTRQGSITYDGLKSQLELAGAKRR